MNRCLCRTVAVMSLKEAIVKNHKRLPNFSSLILQTAQSRNWLNAGFQPMKKPGKLFKLGCRKRKMSNSWLAILGFNNGTKQKEPRIQQLLPTSRKMEQDSMMHKTSQEASGLAHFATVVHIQIIWDLPITPQHSQGPAQIRQVLVLLKASGGLIMHSKWMQPENGNYLPMLKDLEEVIMLYQALQWDLILRQGTLYQFHLPHM